MRTLQRELRNVDSELRQANDRAAQYAEAFEKAGILHLLEAFSALHGAAFYGLPPNSERVALEQTEWTVPASMPFGDDVVVPLMAGSKARWRLRDGDGAMSMAAMAGGAGRAGHAGRNIRTRRDGDAVEDGGDGMDDRMAIAAAMQDGDGAMAMARWRWHDADGTMAMARWRWHNGKPRRPHRPRGPCRQYYPRRS